MKVESMYMYAYIVDYVNRVLAAYNMTMEDDIAWVECHPDTVRYPVACGYSNAWGFIVTIRHKSGVKLTNSLVFMSLICPVKGWFS
jgi:hypothetical protein